MVVGGEGGRGELSRDLNPDLLHTGRERWERQREREGGGWGEGGRERERKREGEREREGDRQIDR